MRSPPGPWSPYIAQEDLTLSVARGGVGVE